MPLIRSSASKRRLRLVLLILSLGKIILLCSCCVEKRLSYIAILAPFSCQPSSYTKCTKSNMCSSYNVRSVFNAKYVYLMRSYILQNL